jgi:replicative DNA helicase
MRSVAAYFNSIKSGKWVKVVLSEMSGDTFTLRMACSLAGVSSALYHTGQISPDEAAKVTAQLRILAELPILFYDNFSTFREIEDALRDKTNPTGFWVLDCIGQFIQPRQRDSNGAAVDAVNITQRLCKEYAAGLIVAHMNRESERTADKRPTLANYSGTDQIGRNVDLALGLHRPWMYLDLDDEARNSVQPAELIMLKNRVGLTQTIHLVYNPTLSLFEEETDVTE